MKGNKDKIEVEGIILQMHLMRGTKEITIYTSDTSNERKKREEENPIS